MESNLKIKAAIACVRAIADTLVRSLGIVAWNIHTCTRSQVVPVDLTTLVVRCFQSGCQAFAQAKVKNLYVSSYVKSNVLFSNVTVNEALRENRYER